MHVVLWLMVLASPAPAWLDRVEEPSDEVKPFVPAGHDVLTEQTADLDRDGREDVVVILKRLDEETIGDGTDHPRPLLLLIRQADGKLKQVRRNDKVVYCRRCGGMMGDPFEELRAERGRFTVSVSGGSASAHWAVSYTFAYDGGKKDWFLHEEASSGDHRVDAPGSNEREVHERRAWTTSIAREELGDIPFESVDYDREDKYETKSWRVRSERTYFYDQPDLKAKPRKGYLVKGDLVDGYRETKNFIQVSFTNKQGRSTDGFLLKKDLEPAPPAPARE